MPFLDKLDRMLPGGKQRAADNDAATQAEVERKTRINAFVDKIEKSSLYKDYMESDLGSARQDETEDDVLRDLLYSATLNSDVEGIKAFAKLVKGDFDLKTAVEDVEDKKIYDLVVSLNKDEDFWKQNTNMKRDDEFSEGVSIIIDGANRYL